MRTCLDFFADESGATSIEYALVAVLIGVGVLGGLQALGDQLVVTYDGFSAAFPQNAP